MGVDKLKREAKNIRKEAKIDPKDAESFHPFHDAHLRLHRLREQEKVTMSKAEKIVGLSQGSLRKHLKIQPFIAVIRGNQRLLKSFDAYFGGFESFEAFWSGDWWRDHVLHDQTASDADKGAIELQLQLKAFELAVSWIDSSKQVCTRRGIGNKGECSLHQHVAAYNAMHADDVG